MAHLFGVFLNHTNVAAAGFVELSRAIFLEHAGEAAHAAQGGAKVVGDGVGERFELLVDGFQLRGAAFHAVFQFRVQTADFILRLDAGGDVERNTAQKAFAGNAVERKLVDQPLPHSAIDRERLLLALPWLAAFEHSAVVFEEQSGVILGKEVEVGGAIERMIRGQQTLAPDLIGVHIFAANVLHERQCGIVVHEAAKSLFAFHQGGFGPLFGLAERCFGGAAVLFAGGQGGTRGLGQT